VESIAKRKYIVNEEIGGVSPVEKSMRVMYNIYYITIITNSSRCYE